MNIHTEMPFGNRSHGYERATLEEAESVFGQMVAQIKKWKQVSIDVIISDDHGKELKREHLYAA